jgi:ubiquinone/menaquinone biosynthesis C-methylase UbiE
MIRSIVRGLAGVPAVFDLLRWVLEGGFSGHRSVFENELQDIRGWIVDLGCGTGQHCRQFSAESYIGLDLSKEYLVAARSSSPGYQWCHANATRIPLRSESVDRVVVSGLLHHLDDSSAGETLCEAARILKRDGLLVVWEDIPAVAWWNFIGSLAHRLDVGSWIRPAEGYRELLSGRFMVISERKIRSGFMDYAVFVCKPRLTE